MFIFRQISTWLRHPLDSTLNTYWWGFMLTHWGRVTHICVDKLSLVQIMACRLDGAKWKFNQNTTIFIEENAYENVVYEMASILSRPQYVNRIHYNDVIMTTMASKINSLAVVYSIVYSGANQRKHQSSASLAFVRGIHRSRWIPRTKGQ